MFSKQVVKEHLGRYMDPFVPIKLHPNVPYGTFVSWLISSSYWLPVLINEATIFNTILFHSCAPIVTACQLMVYIVHCDSVFLLIPCTINKYNYKSEN